ncbi:MAG TPA: hypothetical protein VF604_20665 [Pyrinomonadaceae bacterium]|jgi:hypothetical protein
MKICPVCQREYESANAKFCAVDGESLVEQTYAAAPPQYGAQPTGAPFSASLALAFFAHRFIEVMPPEKSGTLSFCQPNVKVNSWQLVTELPIIAFWHLYENNCIRFTPTAKAAFLRSDITLVIEANPASQASFPCLEHDFWEIIKRSPPGVTVETVFKQFLGGRNTEPEKNLIERLTAWMIQLGYGQPDNSPKPFFRMGSIPLFEKFAPDCRRIAAQQQAAQIIHRRWMKFRAEQPDVFYYLFDDVVDAAINRVGNSKIHSSHYWHAESFRRYGKT